MDEVSEIYSLLQGGDAPTRMITGGATNRPSSYERIRHPVTRRGGQRRDEPRSRWRGRTGFNRVSGRNTLNRAIARSIGRLTFYVTSLVLEVVRVPLQLSLELLQATHRCITRCLDALVGKLTTSGRALLYPPTINGQNEDQAPPGPQTIEGQDESRGRGNHHVITAMEQVSSTGMPSDANRRQSKGNETGGIEASPVSQIRRWREFREPTTGVRRRESLHRDPASAGTNGRPRADDETLEEMDWWDLWVIGMGSESETEPASQSHPDEGEESARSEKSVIMSETSSVDEESGTVEELPEGLGEVTASSLKKFAMRRPGPAPRMERTSQWLSNRNSIPEKSPDQLAMETKDQESHSTLSDLNQSHRPRTPRHSSRPLLGTILPTLLILCLILMSLSSTTKAEESGKEYDIEKREFDPDLREPVNLTAFDCSQPKPDSWRGIDLTRIDPCPDIDTDYEDVRNATTTLVQSGLAVGINITRCDLQVSHKLRVHEGIFHNAPTELKTLSDDDRTHLSGNWCRGLLKSKVFICTREVCGGNRDSPQIPFEIGEEVQVTYWAAGDYTNGAATSDSFHFRHDGKSASQLYKGVLEVLVKIRVSTYPASVDYQADRIWSDVLPFQAKYSLSEAAVGIDRYGTVAWEQKEHRCEEQLGLITTSTATAIRKLHFSKRPGNGRFEYAGALAIITNSTEQRASGVVISDEKHHCMDECYLTNIPQVLMCIDVDLSERIDPIETRVSDSTTIARINAQAMGTYLQLTSKLDIVAVSRLLQKKICELDSRATRQDFAMLLNGRSPYALQGLATGITDYPTFGHNGTALTFSVRGSTAYFAVCPEEEVQLVSLPKCSLQIPVVRSDGTLAFVDAINRHLVALPTWVECDSGLPVQYHINGLYYCQGVNTHEVCSAKTQPVVLKPSVGKVRGLKVDELPPLAGLTINPKEMSMISNIIREQEYGRIIETKLIHATILSTDEVTESNGGQIGIHLGIPLSGIDISLVAGGVATQLFYLFRYLGNIYLNFFGIVFAVSLTRQFIFFWIRVYQVTRIYGCGKWMWLAVWNSAWVTFAMPKLVLKSVYNTAEKEFQKQRVNDMPIPDNAQLAHKQKEMCEAFTQMQHTLSAIQVFNHGSVHPSGAHPGVNPTIRGPFSKWSTFRKGEPHYSRLDDGLLFPEDPRVVRENGKDPGGRVEYSSFHSFSTEGTIVGQEEDQVPRQGQVPKDQGAGQADPAGLQAQDREPQGLGGRSVLSAGVPVGAVLKAPTTTSPFSRGNSETNIGETCQSGFHHDDLVKGETPGNVNLKKD